MPLPTPLLDDRRFQDLVDHAKRMIPQYCPEWTDHNVSDPGVTLIELFAWMADMLLYRVNQVPEKIYIKFLELLGVRLEPPRAAHVPVTFYLSASQPVDVVIPAETEVATVRTETSPAIIFTTESDLVVRPSSLIGSFTRQGRRGGSAGWVVHDLRQLKLGGRRIAVFPTPPAPGDAWYLAFGADHGNQVLSIHLECEIAGGAGVDPNNPPLEWQVWQGGVNRWVNCEIEYDGTYGFNDAGDVIMHLPTMVLDEFQGVQAYWLRCRLTDAQAQGNGYKVSPDIEDIVVETRGGTVMARHAITVMDEIVGRSEGTPGQRFRLLQTPILARDPERDYLVIEPPTGEAEQWHEVGDFADSGPADRHYTLDSVDGTLILGPSLLQPDGSVYRFGAIPPAGSVLRFRRYQHGGGVMGNIPRSMLTVLKSSIPYVARVINRLPAQGGLDAQSIEDAIVRAPQKLRTRTRAVTADDYEFLAREIGYVARARCIGPESQPGGPGDPQPGQVFVFVLPFSEQREGYLTLDQLTLSAELHSEVLGHLSSRSVIGTRVDVFQPQYLWVTVHARLRLAAHVPRTMLDTVQQRSDAALARYLNPYVGGPQGDGWPFGRELNQSEIYSLLQRIPEIEFVEELTIGLTEPGSNAPPQAVPARFVIPKNGLICSAQHWVTVTTE